MYTYPMKALSKRGDIAVTFTLEDAPCMLDNNHFILLKRPGTPILRYKDIMRGMDVPGLYEGDVLVMNNETYSITYQQGFMALSENKELVDIADLKNATVIRNKIFDENKINNLLIQKFKVDDFVFDMSKIFGTYEGNLIINVKGGMIVPFEKIQQYAGVRYNGVNMFFGDLVNGYPLILKDGKCGIDTPQGFIKIKDIQKLEETTNENRN